LLTGCPAEETPETTSTTTTTETVASPAASAEAPPAASATPGRRVVPAAHVDAKAIFAQKCAGCHGANGGGSVGPALSNVDARGDADIADYIVNGSPNKVMPAFGQQLKAEEVDALVLYVKTL